MKRFAIVAVFMFAIICILSACGDPAKEMTDAEAMTKLEPYIADGDVDIVSYLNDKGFSLGARGWRRRLFDVSRDNQRSYHEISSCSSGRNCPSGREVILCVSIKQ